MLSNPLREYVVGFNATATPEVAGRDAETVPGGWLVRSVLTISLRICRKANMIVSK